ncbi:MAG: VOC family protein [Cyclobacteriaceae bacterium]|nr:VOC family protein [Cyclobacteriaceae bacterium]
MVQKIAHIALIVNDYDEAIEFYTRKVKFVLIEDSSINDQKRWVLVARRGSKECRILLARASDEEQQSHVGNQTGGRVFLFLHTDNFDRDYRELLANGIKIVRQPSAEPVRSFSVVAMIRIRSNG